MDLKERVRQLKNDIPAVFLSLKDPDTPLTAKLLAGITVAYALSPIDLIPDFIPVIGYLDDILLLPLLITLTVRLIPGRYGSGTAGKQRMFGRMNPQENGITPFRSFSFGCC